MSVVKLVTWIGITFLLANVPVGGADVCHSPHISQRPDLNWAAVHVTDAITKDVEVGFNFGIDFSFCGLFPKVKEKLHVYYHPWGETTETTIGLRRGGPITRVTPGPLFEDVCGLGDNENTAYQLKIYSKDQDPRTDLIDKPILVTQGFDANYKIPGEQFDFDQFERILDRVFTNNTNQTLCNGESLLRKLYDEGYDIVLLLWKNPLIDIRTNARVTLQALRWLKDHTDPREGTEPVIIAPSLGGLVTRYALQLAGGDFPSSGINARLFIAFDSPNRGAEVPMSLQAFLSYFRDEQGQKFENLTSLAARQLLLSSPTQTDATGKLIETGKVFEVIDQYEKTKACGDKGLDCIHGKFMEEINGLEFRRQIKNIVHNFAGRQEPIYTAAIINGSGTGKDFGYFGGQEYLGLDAHTLGLKLFTEGGPLVFHGSRAHKKFLDFTFQEPAFMEDAPGGFRSTYGDIRKGVESKCPSFSFIDCTFTGHYEWNEANDLSVVNHSFIPSLSGVGLLGPCILPICTSDGATNIDFGNINSDQSWFSRVGTRGTCFVGDTCMFDEFRAPEDNQQHVTVTQENKEWFLELIHTRGPQAPPQTVEPIAGTVCENEDSTLTATFTYNNPNAFDITILIGDNNRFAGTGIPENVGQPETFFRGKRPALFGVIFGAIVGRGLPEWTLNGITVKATIPSKLRPCGPFISQ